MLAYCRVISTKQILFAVAPGALRIVSRPSETVTVAVPSTHRDALVDVPLTVKTLSTAIPKGVPKNVGSADTTRTWQVRLGTATSQNALGFAGRCIYASVS